MSLPNLLKIIQKGFNRKLTHKIIKVLKLTRQFDDYDKKNRINNYYLFSHALT